MTNSPSDANTPPSQLLTPTEMVEERLRQLFAVETQRWHDQDPRLGEAIEILADIVLAGGKRLRAGLCYWAWYGLTDHHGTSRQSLAVDAGAGFELLQAFALVHDDIMDNSATRRGQKTVHHAQANRAHNLAWAGEPRRFGEGVAILVGDLGHVYADKLMAKIPAGARDVWDEMRIEVNLGQYLDLRSTASGELNHSTAQKVSMFKSGLYTIVRPLQLGALLHPLAQDDANTLVAKLEAFGQPLGRAFQLRDDLLGVLGDQELIGKPVGDDIREGKPTELIAYALAHANLTQGKVLSGLGSPLSPKQIDEVVAVLIEVGAVDEIRRRIQNLVDQAISLIDGLPFNSESQAALKAIANYVGDRQT